MPKSYLSDEEKVGLDHNGICAVESAAAARAGDHETEWEWLRLADLPAHSLLSAKHRNGADWIRKMGLKTDAAEKAYGNDWLERDI